MSDSLQPHSTPGFPIHHQLPELAQGHVHWVSDAIQPSHPLLSSSPPAFNPSQHQGLPQWVSSSQKVANKLFYRGDHISYHPNTSGKWKVKLILISQLGQKAELELPGKVKAYDCPNHFMRSFIIKKQDRLCLPWAEQNAFEKIHVIIRLGILKETTI